MNSNKADYRAAGRKAKEVIADNFILQPPVRIDQLVQNYGLGIYEAEFESPYNNVCGFIDFETKCIVLNSSDHLTRKAFTLAHELGHWLLHKDVLDNNPSSSMLYRKPLGEADADPMEQEANCFAANLLVPAEFLHQYKHEDIGLIARIFGVSTEVIGYRLGRKRSR